MKVYNFLALHLVNAAFLLCHELHFNSNLRPVMTCSIKYPRPYSTIGTVCTSVAVLCKNNIIFCHPVYNRISSRSSQRIKYNDTLPIFFKKSLITFNRFHSIVFSFTFLPGQHNAIDPTIHVYVVHIVNLSTIVPCTHS